MSLEKIPEGTFFVSSQGHWRYGNKALDEEWIIPTSKIKLSESSLIFGKAITSNGYYTNIKDKSKDTCFGITLEDIESRKEVTGNSSSSDIADADGYTTHIIQSGLLRFVKIDFNDCFESEDSSGIPYQIGQKIYLNSSGKFTNNLERIIESSYRIVELGEITNKFNGSISSNDFFLDLSINIKNHNKIETDTARFVDRCDSASNFPLATGDFGNKNICVFSWNENGKLIPADIAERREVAGLYIGEITNTFASDIGGKQIELIRNGKIYLDEMPSAKVYDTDGSVKEWLKLDNLTKGTQLYLEKDGSISSSPYLDNSVAAYSCPIMTYLGQTADGNKYTFYVDIKRPEVRRLEDLYLFKTFTPSINATQSAGSDSSTINEQLDITEVLNYGNFTKDDLNKIEESLEIHLFVKSDNSLYNGYIFKDKWVEINPGFFHFDTIRSYGYTWDVISSNNKIYLKMNIADGFGLSIESGKNTGPIVCNSNFDCKVIVKRLNESKIALDAGVNTSFEESILNNERNTTKVIKNSLGEAIKTIYDLENRKVKYLDESNNPATVVALTETPSKAKLKRVYDEDKFSELNTDIYGDDGATDNTSDTTKNHFDKLGEAMRAIYETPLALWNYKTDASSNKQKVGIIVDRLNERTETIDLGSRPIDSFDSQQTFSYTQNEKDEIKRFIRLLTDNNESGIDNTNTIGIILKALKETQQRLIDLEAATYGLTSNKITSGNSNTSKIDKGTGISSNSLDFGLNRIVRALAFEIFGNSNPTNQTLEYDESSFSFFDFIEKSILGTKPTIKPNSNSYELDNSAEPLIDINSEDNRTHTIKNFDSKYYSYDEEADPNNYGFKTDGWSKADSTKENNKVYKFNGIEDATYRLINRANILTQMIFYNNNANKGTSYNGSLLSFSHNKMLFN